MADANHTRIGEGPARVDGRLKVTGQARFPSDTPLNNPAYAWLITSTIAKGRIKAFHLAEARKVPGFLDILTFENTKGEIKTPPALAGKSTLTVESDEIQHDGQIIGLVVADTLEAAREAAYKVSVDYEVQTASAGFDSPGVTARSKAAVDPRAQMPKKGDALAAFAAAPTRIQADYETATQHHNPLELYTTTCEWTDGKLTIHEPSQFVYGRGFIADNFGLKPQDVRVISRFVGGGFGGKSSGTARTALVALAAKRLNRPVKLVPTRADGFTIATYRAETRHHIKLGAGPDGRIVAFVHQAQEITSRPTNTVMAGVETTSGMYDYGAVASGVTIVNADRNSPGFMRSPGEVPSMFALECAVDELAYALKIDPVELRRINDAQTDPSSGKPYSSRSLVQCFAAAASAFGWSRRNPQPRSMRDGDWLIGWGCASACHPSAAAASAVRVALNADSSAKVQVAFHEIGNGAYTVIAQTAADRLGLPIEKVTVELGDTNLPPGNMAAGSNGTASTCNAVNAVCEQIRGRLAEAAVKDQSSPLFGRDAASLRLTSAGLVGAGAGEPLARSVGRLGPSVEALGEWVNEGVPPGATQRLSMGIPAFDGGHPFSTAAYGAQFVEVRVHARTGEIRVARLLGAYAAGTIVNSRTARSQLLGGQIWGMSSALHESTEIDRRYARYTNDNFADYLIPVNADVPSVEVIFVAEDETRLNPMGIKGVGELGNVGMDAAVANAVYHATGKRIRKLPIRMEDLI